jgi:hypothetical protein
MRMSKVNPAAGKVCCCYGSRRLIFWFEFREEKGERNSWSGWTVLATNQTGRLK